MYGGKAPAEDSNYADKYQDLRQVANIRSAQSKPETPRHSESMVAKGLKNRAAKASIDA